MKEGSIVPRRGNVPKREILPDPMYNSVLVTKLVNSIMLDGKKGVAQKVVYGAFDIIKDKTEKAQNAWAQKEKNLQYEASQLQEKYQKGLITTADAQKQQQSIEKKIANYQSSAQKEAQTLDEENYVFSNRTQDLIMRAIKEINADKKYKLIVNATALLDADDALDITDTVLAKVDELYAAEKNDTAKSDK